MAPVINRALVKSKRVEECPKEDDESKKWNTLPRLWDTFWLNDLSTSPCLLSGHDMLNKSFVNKSLGFTHRERQLYCIHGLLPYAVRTLDEQVAACRKYYDLLKTPQSKFSYLNDMQYQNRRLFYRLLLSDVSEYMPILDSSAFNYMIKNYSLLYTYGTKGLFITIKDRGHVLDILKNWPHRYARCLLVTNGAAVLSMGDNGAHGMAVLCSKFYQHVVFGGIHPDFCIPIFLDVGTNNEELLNDKLYVGLREKRCSRKEYDEFFEEFATAVISLYGPRCIIQCKAFDTQNANTQLEKYRNRQCIIDTDFQCLGACALAGVITANQLTRKPFKTNMFLFYGQHSINVGMARLCIAYLKREGLNDNMAKSRVWLCDENGLIVFNRPNHKVPDELLEFQHEHEPIESLVEAIETLKPNVLVGACSQPNSFTKDVLRAMERSSEQPIIFASSRPIEQAECSAEDAFVYTKGRCVFISGSNVPRVKYANKWYAPGRCTSIYLLSGVALGIMLSGMTTVPDEAFCVAADRLATLVWPKDLALRHVFPPMRKIQCISLQIAESIFTYAYRRRLATLWPQPTNPMDYIKSHLYESDYRENVFTTYCMSNQVIATSESATYYKEKI
ncbi:uncharacterized protein Dwil_GK21699 [Drosophila willistoni]|uniref:GK21699 n=1 Tax=Drosophila willistoni TaxID=7260 RepID=B4MPG9_DROWI|nr:NADP-dependent malic enzyme [Drosophila willistoni]EDW74008.1 uncharacterized protein Dwil_GK21699 [Drosophila willistoni]